MSYYLSSIGNKYNELVSIDNNIVTRGNSYMPLQDVSTILGHAQLETTKIYCVLEDYEVKQSYQRYSM